MKGNNDMYLKGAIEFVSDEFRKNYPELIELVLLGEACPKHSPKDKVTCNSYGPFTKLTHGDMGIRYINFVGFSSHWKLVGTAKIEAMLEIIWDSVIQNCCELIVSMSSANGEYVFHEIRNMILHRKYDHVDFYYDKELSLEERSIRRGLLSELRQYSNVPGLNDSIWFEEWDESTNRFTMTEAINSE